MVRSRLCDACGSEYKPSRSHSRYCSGPCRQKAYRERQQTPISDYHYADEGHAVTTGLLPAEHQVKVPAYISTQIIEAEKKWRKRRGTDGTTIVHPSGPK